RHCLGRRDGAAGHPPDHHVRAGALRRQEGELRLMSTLTVDKDALAGAVDPAPRNRGRDRGPRRPAWKTGLLIGAVLATIAVFLVPLFWLFSSSMKPHQDIYSWPLRWLPRELTFENFTAAWNSAPFDRFFLNS